MSDQKIEVFAYYELSPVCTWNLVCYHGEKPLKSVNGSSRTRHGPFEVPRNMLGIDNTPNFAMIAQAFPAPQSTELAA